MPCRYFPTMTSRRNLALGALGILGLVLAVLLLVPVLFRDRISERLQAEASKSLNAKVAWSGLSLGLIRSFPNLALGLENLSVAGVGPFEGDTLAKLRRLDLVLDLGSALRVARGGGPLVVRRVALDQPVIRLRVLEDGKANWDITRKDSDKAAAPSDGEGMALALREVRIDDGTLSMDNRPAGLIASLAGIRHRLSGDLSRDKVTLRTATTVDTTSLTFAGVPWLNGVRVALDADLDADMQEKRYTLAKGDLKLNNLGLVMSGSVQPGEPNTAIDLTFSSPSTAFADILSLVPAIYRHDIAKLQTSGTMAVAGKVKGNHGPNAFPSLNLTATVANGSFRYPDLPLPAREIGFDLAVTNPGGSVDSTVVQLQRFHMRLGDRPLDAALTVRTPVSDPDVDFSARGSVDLADVGRTVKLENVKELSGLVNADFAVRTRKSWVDQSRYDRINARGTIGITRMAVQSAALPHAARVDSALLRFTPQRAELATLTGAIGSSDFRASGTLDNLIGYVMKDEVIRGTANVHSRHFNLNEWKSDEKSGAIPVPANVDFRLQVTADSITYGKLGLTGARGEVAIKDQRATLTGFRLNLLGGTARADGFYETTNPERPTFDFKMGLDSLSLPKAFASLATVQALVPIARYANGVLSTQLHLAGPLGKDLMPVLTALTGGGSFSTGGLVVKEFPPMVRLADVLSLDQVRNPTIPAVRGMFEVANGRMSVKPFDVTVGDIAMKVSGSNGIDQSIDYDLAMAVPVKLLGGGATRAVSQLAATAGKAGLDLGAVDAVSIGVEIGGTITNPSIKPTFSGTAGSVREGVQRAAEQVVEEKVTEVKQQVDSAALAQKRRAVAEAEAQAARIRQEADSAAAKVRREGDQAAAAILEKATSPAAKLLAQPAADKVKREANARADQIVREADTRAKKLTDEARRQAE